MNGAESRPIYTDLQADLSPKDEIGQIGYFVFTSGKTWNPPRRRRPSSPSTGQVTNASDHPPNIYAHRLFAPSLLPSPSTPSRSHWDRRGLRRELVHPFYDAKGRRQARCPQKFFLLAPLWNLTSWWKRRVS